MLDFDPKREPCVPASAASVIVLRDAAAGLEVFCVERHVRSGFLGGAVVFPGGKVDPGDAHEAWEVLTTQLHPRTREMADGVDARALAIAALRETLEEGALLATDPPAVDEDASALCAGLREHRPFHELLANARRRLAVSELVPWARWITPEAESRRFDARFFLMRAPATQTGRHDDQETTASFWAKPAAILDRAASGACFLAPPTSRTLELLAAVSDVAGAMALAARQSLLPICPRFVGDGPDAPFLALPGDPSHPISERRVDGPTRYVLRDGRFVSEAAPRIENERNCGRAGASPGESV